MKYFFNNDHYLIIFWKNNSILSFTVNSERKSSFCNKYAVCIYKTVTAKQGTCKTVKRILQFFKYTGITLVFIALFISDTILFQYFCIRTAACQSLLQQISSKSRVSNFYRINFTCALECLKNTSFFVKNFFKWLKNS